MNTSSLPYPAKLAGALVAAIIVALVIYLVAALHVYIIAAVVWLLSLIFG